MVGGNDIDGIVFEPLLDRFNVGIDPKGRAHFGIGIITSHRILRQGKMMRSHLAGHRKALGLGQSNQFHGFATADMRYMQTPSRFLQ